MNKKNSLLFFASLLLSFLIAEALLRVAGVRPGWVNNYDGFERVDSLILYKNFVTDEAGIYKFSPWITDSLLIYFDCQKREVSNARVEQAVYRVDHVLYIYESYCKQIREPNFSWYWKIYEWKFDEADSNSLINTYCRMKEKTMHTDEVWNTAFTDYFYKPFNSEGFRSLPFKNYATKQLKVLVIGDSFVYGMDAHPYQNSFVDLLLAKGYLVYAAGIPGTDPAQYAAIAQKYIPLLQPDVVVNCFYAGNDFMKFEREPNAAQPHEHLTNAGLLASNPYGEYLSPTKAYQYYLSLCTFPDKRNKTFDKICSQSALGTLVWNAMYSRGLVSHQTNSQYLSANSVPQEVINKTTKKYTDRINNICKQYQMPILNAVIPNRQNIATDSATMQYLFGDNFNLPEDIDHKKDFYRDKVHFNNTGSIKFSNFLDKLLKPYARSKQLLFRP